MRIGPAIAAIMLVASPGLADPRKPDPQDPQIARRAAPVILAAAEEAHSSSADASQPSQSAAKRPLGRVTHCRCGDPQPDTQSNDR